MHTVLNVFLIILTIVVVLLAVLYFVGQKTAEEAGGTAGTDGGCQADGFHAGHRQEEAKDEGSRTSSDGA